MLKMAHSSFSKGPFEEKGGGGNGPMPPSRLNTERNATFLFKSKKVVVYIDSGDNQKLSSMQLGNVSICIFNYRVYTQ